MRASLRFVLFLILAYCLALTHCTPTPQFRTLQTTAPSLRLILPLDETIFPDNYPDFLKETYRFLDQAEQLAQSPPAAQEVILSDYPQLLQDFFRAFLEDESLNLERLATFTRIQVPEASYQEFLTLFGIDPDNQEDIELELLAQMERMLRREAYSQFCIL